MRRLITVLVLTILVTLSGAPRPVLAGDATPEPARSTLVALPAGLPDSLPAGDEGTVSVVARSGVLTGGDRVVAVIRNGTERPVANPLVTATVRDAGGRVVASGTAADVAPVGIPAGGLGLALVRLDTAVATGDVDIDIALPSAPTPTAGTVGRMDVALPFLSLDDGVLTGGATAIAIDAAYDPVLLVICLDPTDPATVTGFARAALQPTRIDPYRTIPVRVALPTGCTHLLAAVTAHI